VLARNLDIELSEDEAKEAFKVHSPCSAAAPAAIPSAAYGRVLLDPTATPKYLERHAHPSAMPCRCSTRTAAGTLSCPSLQSYTRIRCACQHAFGVPNLAAARTLGTMFSQRSLTAPVFMAAAEEARQRADAMSREGDTCEAWRKCWPDVMAYSAGTEGPFGTQIFNCQHFHLRLTNLFCFDMRHMCFSNMNNQRMNCSTNH
jgi:hypothetical protein